MIRAVLIIPAYLLFLSPSLAQGRQELILCGWDEVFMLDLNSASLVKTWQWKAQESTDLPEDFRQLFNTTDECKVVEGGSRVLVSSSGGGAALVERSTRRVLWYGRVGNAHSIEMLPNGRIVVAGSTHENGNRLVIFDSERPEKELYQDELYSGHGVVWDAARTLLWALGFQELRAYRLVSWDTPKPELARELTLQLPDEGGHDLYAVPASPDLIVTTHNHVYLFDRDQRRFRFHEVLENAAHVKSVAIHPLTLQTVYIQAEGNEWWARRIRFLDPASELPLPGERLYKARWLTP